MKTPKEYTAALNSGIITKQILGEVIYSYNKRAKNMRDNEHNAREYQRYHRYAIYDNAWNYQNKKMEYYEKKDTLLEFVEPTSIHHIIHRNYYGDKEEFFLFYSVGNHTFHSPITADDAAAAELPITELDSLLTFGHETDTLLSVQFCDKVLAKLTSGECQLSE